MSQPNYTTITPNRERGQHLKFEDRVSIKIFRKSGHSLRAIGEALSCCPCTVKYELDRATRKMDKEAEIRSIELKKDKQHMK